MVSETLTNAFTCDSAAVRITYAMHVMHMLHWRKANFLRTCNSSCVVHTNPALACRSPRQQPETLQDHPPAFHNYATYRV